MHHYGKRSGCHGLTDIAMPIGLRADESHENHALLEVP
jgi:hypothetical protein